MPDCLRAIFSDVEHVGIQGRQELNPWHFDFIAEKRVVRSAPRVPDMNQASIRKRARVPLESPLGHADAFV